MWTLSTSTVPSIASAQALEDIEGVTIQSDTFYRGKVVEILQEEYKENGGEPFVVQTIRVHLQSGEERGNDITLMYEANEKLPGQHVLSVGDRLIIGKSTVPDTMYYVNDVYRLPVLWVLVGLFFFMTVALARWQGFTAFLGLVVSYLIIVYGIIPPILDGRNPLAVSLLGTIAIACTSLYIAHGFRARTSVAFVGIIITILFALGMGYVAIRATSLFGLGSEDAFFLQFIPNVTINLRWLLLGGLIIGTLGILEDVTTAQAAAVEEIHLANTSLSFMDLYQRGLSVGREHIISLVNTLVLAYTGAALPLLLLFTVYERPVWVTANSEMIAEEVVRMLVGSMTLMVAVPVTTLLAAYYFGRMKKHHV